MTEDVPLLPRLRRLFEQYFRLIQESRLLSCKYKVKSYQTSTIQEILGALQHREGLGYHCIPEAQEAQEVQQAPVDLGSYSENRKVNTN